MSKTDELIIDSVATGIAFACSQDVDFLLNLTEHGMLQKFIEISVISVVMATKKFPEIEAPLLKGQQICDQIEKNILSMLEHAVKESEEEVEEDTDHERMNDTDKLMIDSVVKALLFLSEKNPILFFQRFNKMKGEFISIGLLSIDAAFKICNLKVKKISMTTEMCIEEVEKKLTSSILDRISNI